MKRMHALVLFVVAQFAASQDLSSLARTTAREVPSVDVFAVARERLQKAKSDTAMMQAAEEMVEAEAAKRGASAEARSLQADVLSADERLSSAKAEALRAQVRQQKDNIQLASADLLRARRQVAELGPKADKRVFLKEVKRLHEEAAAKAEKQRQDTLANEKKLEKEAYLAKQRDARAARFEQLKKIGKDAAKISLKAIGAQALMVDVGYQTAMAAKAQRDKAVALLQAGASVAELGRVEAEQASDDMDKEAAEIDEEVHDYIPSMISSVSEFVNQTRSALSDVSMSDIVDKTTSAVSGIFSADAV